MANLMVGSPKIAEREIFPHAPIVEALLDIRFAPTVPIKVDALKAFQERIRTDYPALEVRKSISGRLQLSATSASSVSTEAAIIGYQFRSALNDRVIQARVDGYSFSRLRPYTNWDQFSQEALGHWTRFAKSYKPKRVTRVALRYINRIELPNPTERLEEYFQTHPTLGAGVPQAMLGYFMRIVLKDPESEAKVIVTQAIDEVTPAGPDRVPIILDIDAFQEGSFATDATQLLRSFEPLHTLKNRVFFESLTNKTRDFFR